MDYFKTIKLKGVRIEIGSCLPMSEASVIFGSDRPTNFAFQSDTSTTNTLNTILHTESDNEITLDLHYQSNDCKFLFLNFFILS